MKKLCLVAAILFVSFVVFAQGTPPSGQLNAQTSSEATAADPGGATIEGCLAGSSGNFTLTDSSGKKYQLAGDTAKLGEHVGHTLRVWGSEKGAGGDTQGAAGSSGSAQPTFTVQKVKMVSPSCSTSK
jgi:hypothetical protein